MHNTEIDGFRLIKTLGSGYSAKVKLAVDSEGNQYALKIFDLSNPDISQEYMKLLKQEVEATKKLDHKHIVKYLKFEESTIWRKKNGSEIPVAYIMQEAVLGGELFEYVFNNGSFSEPICRYYLK